TEEIPQPGPSASTTQGDTPKEHSQPALARRPAPALRSPVAQRADAAGKTASSTGGWMVQLGVFANHANADRLARELKGQGFHALVSQNSGAGRTLWRVRAGPVAERAAAEQLGARLRAAGHAGSIVPK
ncbi:MAG: SPOR domain-containing protein, partial [Steroidobacteraceae bacterium]